MTHNNRAFAKLRPIELNEAAWTGGFWGEKWDLLKNHMISSMARALEDPKNGTYLGNFRVLAGTAELDEFHACRWSDGDCYKYMEALLYVYEKTRDERILRELDEWVKILEKAQAYDGYLCTQIQMTGKKRLHIPVNHELYNFGHLLTTGSVHKRITGKDNFLKVSIKAADYLYRTFTARRRELCHFCWNPSQIMGLIDLYRVTGDERYKELAAMFVENRGSGDIAHDDIPRDECERDPGDNTQDLVPLKKESFAVGHCVCATYLYSGAADVYAENGDQELLAALTRIWNDMAHRKMYVTGAIGTYHRGISIREMMVTEAFGAAYELPNASAYNETCANIGNAMWNWRMFNLTGDAGFADLMEQVMYNSGLSGVSMDGEHFCYTNPLRWHGKEHDLLSNDRIERWETHGCYCCPPQVSRTIGRMHEWAFSKSGNGLWINLYGSADLDVELNGKNRIRLSMQSDYPWDTDVAIRVNEAPASACTIALRIPGWCESAQLSVNGESVSGLRSGTYAELNRTWKSGDTIELSLPMPVTFMRANHKVEECRNQVAVMRGPVVYCMEDIDLPKDVRLNRIRLQTDAEYTPSKDASLGGAVSIGTEVLVDESAEDGKALYIKVSGKKRRKVKTKLIPYYLWNNRGVPEMSVWLPVA